MSTRALDPRRDHLEQMLQSRRSALQAEVTLRIRAARVEGPVRVSDEIDRSDAVIQDQMDFALIQMKAEALTRIESAMRRLDTGEYGSCAECATDISEARLRALPFAVRCKACEESLERRLQQNRRSGGRTSLDSDVLGPLSL